MQLACCLDGGGEDPTTAQWLELLYCPQVSSAEVPGWPGPCPRGVQLSLTGTLTPHTLPLPFLLWGSGLTFLFLGTEPSPGGFWKGQAVGWVWFMLGVLEKDGDGLRRWALSGAGQTPVRGGPRQCGK